MFDLKKIMSLIFLPICLFAQDVQIGQIRVAENFGLQRHHEYVVFATQLEKKLLSEHRFHVYAKNDSEKIYCQVFDQENLDYGRVRFSVIFPVSVNASESKLYDVYLANHINEKTVSDLQILGSAHNITIENVFYKADLTRNEQYKGQASNSGQLRRLFLKDSGVVLSRRHNRMHWAPNFQRPTEDDYRGMANWNFPTYYKLDKGPYLVQTKRQDLAPEYPEILLTGTYQFYADKPYFRFFSCIEFQQGVLLSLLRNDEMTMDSLFTHVACKKVNGQIVDVTFSDRYDLFEQEPIKSDAPWVCFYNEKEKYAFASIRIEYNILDAFGRPSPEYRPHTKISDGKRGGKYWNRIIINEHPTFVPKGSRYFEENVYLVFKINDKEKFKEIEYWTKRLTSPLTVEYRSTNKQN